MAASVQIGAIEVAAIDRVMESNDAYDKPHPSYNHIPRAADQVSSILAGISPLLDDQTLYARMEARANLGKFQSAIGSTNATSSDYLMDNNAIQDTEPNSDDKESIEENDQLMATLYEEATSGTLDLDDIMVSAAHASRPTGITAEQLSKTSRIDMDAAERTIGISIANEVTTPPYPKIMAPTIGCYGTSASTNISSWIPSLRQRRQGNHLGGIHAANYS